MSDFAPVWLTLALAATTTLVLLLLGTPLAWWLAHTRARALSAVEALTALPLVLLDVCVANAQRQPLRR